MECGRTALSTEERGGRPRSRPEVVDERFLDTKIARDLINRINRHELTLGVLVTEHLWPDMMPLLKEARLDYVIIDCEHGSHSDEAVAQACTSGRQVGFPVLVRPISTNYSIVRRAIDMGPCGLMLPCVDHPHQLDEVRDAIWMPPRGRRRPGGPGMKWISSSQYAAVRAEFEEDFVVLPQIESKIGLTNLDAIARHEITTAMAVGPFDLSAELGCCFDPNAPQLLEALASIRQAATAVHKNMWIIGDGPALQKRGYTFMGVGEPVRMMKFAVNKVVEQMHGNVPASPGPASEAISVP